MSTVSAQAATATRRISLYSPEISLMAETELTTAARPAVLYEYIWFDGQPMAQVDGAGAVSWTFTDHLGTPLLQTSALQGIVWRAEHEPYGSIYALRSYDRHQPLRFPGQEAEQLGTGANGVTERSYNVHRWYRAGWGRYTQVDPLISFEYARAFIYAESDPLRFTDPFGLEAGAVPIGGITCRMLKPKPNPNRESCCGIPVYAFSNLIRRRFVFCANLSNDKSVTAMLKSRGISLGGAPLPEPWIVPSGNSCVDECRCFHERLHHRQINTAVSRGLPSNLLAKPPASNRRAGIGDRRSGTALR
jgi:RHS repeat-associated protein